MTNLVKIRSKLGIPQFFVIKLNTKRVMYCPFPSHDRKIGDKTNGIHDVGTLKEWRVNPLSKASFSSVF